MEITESVPVATEAPPRRVRVETAAPEPSGRLTSLDVFRGVTMVFMASEILGIPGVAREFPESATARFLARNLDHVQWTGWVPWDLIQPSFMFMVGVALPFSIASRMARGQPFSHRFAHAAWRALVLILLGIFLRSQTHPQTYFTFEDVLTQIGLGYVFLWLLGHTKVRVQWAAAVAILVLYWGAFALYPVPPVSFDTTTVGVPADWPHQLQGFEAHWNKNTNLAARVDQWFLNLFPRESPFVFNRGGYNTLNFVPSLATMIFGLLAGGLMRSGRSARDKLRLLLFYGAAGIAIGWLLHVLGVNPLVKRIWTPSWAIFSAGWAAIFLAFFYYVIDVRGYRRWSFPFLVVGMNSIAMYTIVHVAERYTVEALQIHFGRSTFEVFGAVYAHVLLGAAALAIFWGLMFWMYHRKIFLRI